MNKHLNVALIGYPGSGKSTAGDYLEEKYDFTQVSGSDLLQQHAQAAGRSLLSREDFHNFYAEMRAKYGNDFIARAGLEMSAERTAHIGIRTIADTEYLLGVRAVLLGITCDLPTRFERTAGTSNKYPVDIAAFEQDDKLEDSHDEYGPQVALALAEAHHIVDNNGSYSELTTQIDDIIDIYL